MRARRNNCKSIFTTTIYNNSRNILGKPNLNSIPKLTITSRSSPGDGGITYMLTQAQFDTIKQIHDEYTMKMAKGNYEAIPTNYDQYVTLLNNLDTVNVSDSTLKILISLVEKSLIGSMNIHALNDSVLYDELQILLLNNQIQDILSNKNTKEAISDPDAVTGQIKLEKTFKLSKIFSYYIYLYGMPAFGVGFDAKKLQFIQRSLNMFNAGQMDEPDARIIETDIDASGNEIRTNIPNPEYLPEVPIETYDISNALRVIMDVRLFNTKLGIYKDSSNINIYSPINDYYDVSNSKLFTNAIQITNDDFVHDLSMGISRIVSIGALNTLYSDFSYYISSNFDISHSRFYASSPIPNKGVFDIKEFIRVIKTPNKLQDSVLIPNITENLRNLVINNQFGNRDPINGLTASDPKDRSNYNAADGFYAGDRFIVQNTGYQVTLQSIADPTTYYTGKSHIPYGVLQIQTSPGEHMTTYITKINHNTANISRTVQVSLVIELANVTLF